MADRIRFYIIALVFSLITGSTVWADTLRELPGYHDYAAVVGILEDYAAQYPDIVRLVNLGPSTGKIYLQYGWQAYADYNHDILGLKISDNPDEEEDEPNIFIGGTIHAREIIGTEVTLTVLDSLLSGYGTDTEMTRRVHDLQLWFFPLMNPDGAKVVHDGLNYNYRKSMSDNNGNHYPDASNLDGVDLNRNFGYVWGPNGTSDSPSSQIYHGPEAWSEPETRYFRDLLRNHHFVGAITYHSSGEWVLYPLGHLPGACSIDHEAMGDLAVEMAATIPSTTGTGTYTPAQAVDFGYTCQGTMGDWGYAEQRIFSFTIELAIDTIPMNVPEICEANHAAAFIFIDRVARSTVTGRITDSEGYPIQASVFVGGLDDAPGMSPVEPVRSDSLFGRYHRMLMPGTYDFTFAASGYETVIVNDVAVTENGVTNLDVLLTSSGTQPIPQPVFLSVSPNPFREMLEMQFDLPDSRSVGLEIYNIRGQKIKTIAPTYFSRGRNIVQWDSCDDNGQRVGSGVYLARVTAGKETAVIKCTLIR